MVESKSDKLSERHKDEGNKKFQNTYFYDALICYNKALCYAATKKFKSLAYANRSAVFLELKKYDECLKNIEWARDGYPPENVQKLNEREEKCKRLKEAQVYDPEEDLWNFFKLSHPPNPKVPFIIDCLEVRKTEKYGRGIYTTRDLKAGDFIAIEKASMRCINSGGKYCRCCSCGEAAMMNLIPCEKSASLMFCSLECRDNVYKGVKNLDDMMTGEFKGFSMEKILFDADKAFGGRENLLKFIEENDITKMEKTIFDYDLSDPNDTSYEENLMKCVLALDSASDRKHFREVSKKARTCSKGNPLIEKFLKHMGIICVENGFACAYIPRGGNLLFNRINEALLLRGFISLMNHSCDHNVITIETNDVISIVYCRKPIKAGEQLFINYLADEVYTPRSNRRAVLQNSSRFYCDCYNCLKDIDTEDKYPSAENPIIEVALEKSTFFSDFSINTPRKYAFRQIKENFEILNQFCQEHPTMECVNLINATYTMIHCLSMSMTYPCLKEKWMEHPFRK